MRRTLLLAVVVSGLLVAFAGIALADIITCNGGRCEGTQLPDDITGTDVRDRIFALGGGDFIEAFAGDDEINGNNGSDHIHGGGDGNDLHNGGAGPDSLEEFGTMTGRDVMNGGSDADFIEGGLQGDTLRGQAGDECFSGSGFFGVEMFGDEGNDDLFGGTGEDCMEGEEGTDEHYGGDNNDFIDAVDEDELGTRDVVDCGGGFDTAEVREPEDIVRGNCENVIEQMAITTSDSGTTDEDQQLQKEAFLQEHGLAPEPAG